MVERNIHRGQVSSEEAEKHLKNLPDDAANAVHVTEADLEKQELLSRRS